MATLVEQISGGENNKLLKLNKGYGDEFDISIPVNVRTKFANNYVFSADLILQSENEGEIFDISWRSTGGDAITIIRAAIISENSKKYLVHYF